ncbi:MAG: hypothetical protein ACI85E_001822, partial [Marinomonas primoryensis]
LFDCLSHSGPDRENNQINEKFGADSSPSLNWNNDYR